MPDFQSYVFARGLANSARRINGFPLENRTGGIHGHTFRFTACAPFVDASPATFEDQLGHDEEPSEDAELQFTEIAEHVRVSVIILNESLNPLKPAATVH